MSQPASAPRSEGGSKQTAVRIAIVVPCYNEQEVLGETTKQLTAILTRLVAADKIHPESRIVYVDDGSDDSTWSLITSLCEQYPAVKGLKLSRNCGHQNALLAGLYETEGEVLISLDADLQDDVGAIESMLDAHAKGADVVYGVREDRSSDTAFKRWTAQSFYKALKLLGVNVIYNHADYRLMSRRAIEGLREFGEVNLFLRGIVPLVGYKSATITYARAKRFAGESKYPLSKMIAFALHAITSFSITPLRFITMLGLLIFALSILMSLIVLFYRFFTDATIEGWTSIVLPVYLIGGVQIFCIGILGEYLGKIYQEVKQRPRFIIEERI